MVVVCRLDNLFGHVPRQDFKTPTRGRFAYVPVMMNATDYSNIHNSYGILQSPWNNEPLPFMTRSDRMMGFVNHKKPYGCRAYRDVKMKKNWRVLNIYVCLACLAQEPIEKPRSPLPESAVSLRQPFRKVAGARR